MNDQYLPLEEFLKQNHPEPENSECYIIDAVLSVSAGNIGGGYLEYVIIHRLPFFISAMGDESGDEPNGKIFLQAFESMRDQWGEKEFPYYKKLTEDVAKITDGDISERYPNIIDYVIRPKRPMKVSDILQWIKEYAKIEGVTKIDARVRTK